MPTLKEIREALRKGHQIYSESATKLPLDVDACWLWAYEPGDVWAYEPGDDYNESIYVIYLKEDSNHPRLTVISRKDVALASDRFTTLIQERFGAANDHSWESASIARLWEALADHHRSKSPNQPANGSITP